MKTPGGRRRLTPPIIASIGATVLVITLFLSFLFSSGLMHPRSAGIELPGEADGAPVVSTGSKTLTVQSVADVEINLNNARQVIASLSRPTEYSYRVENRLAYTGGSSALYCIRYARNDAVRTDTVDAAGTVQSTLLRVDSVAYAWNAGERSFYKGSWGDFSEDAAAMLPTYEDVLEDGLAYTAAGKQEIDLEPCIYVEFEKNGYRCRYDISAVSGLLRAASFYEGETLVRQVTVSELKLEAPADELFQLPNGQSILGE